MAAVAQFKVVESTRLSSELQDILCALSENVCLLSKSPLIPKYVDVRSYEIANLSDQAEHLLSMYLDKHGQFSTPTLFIRLNEAVRYFSGSRFARAICDHVELKLSSSPQNPIRCVSFPSLVDISQCHIDKCRINHVRTFVSCNNLVSAVEDLKKLRDELKAKVDSPKIVAGIRFAGLKARRDFLKDSVASLKVHEHNLQSLMSHVREASKMSLQFEAHFNKKKSQLTAANACLKQVSSNVISMKHSAQQNLNSAIESVKCLSVILTELRILSGGKCLNMANSAITGIFRWSLTPFSRYLAILIQVCLSPLHTNSLYKEICRRFGFNPLTTVSFPAKNLYFNFSLAI
uniref:Vacuolar protein sorting-associated protein 53 homolog n=1 Tax=Mesocestoides corti TaxID=53468 RepID=A0A5K3FWZ8_MESCO